MSSNVQDKEAEPIQEGDQVWTPIRGGKRQGEVDEIVYTEEEANEANVKLPPKVIDQKTCHM
jgi:ribosomal protein L25 (general stress protein Ctc)